MARGKVGHSIEDLQETGSYRPSKHGVEFSDEDISFKETVEKKLAEDFTFYANLLVNISDVRFRKFLYRVMSSHNDLQEYFTKVKIKEKKKEDEESFKKFQQPTS